MQRSAFTYHLSEGQVQRMYERVQINPGEFDGFIQGMVDIAFLYRPDVVVELGTQRGHSTFAFCCMFDFQQHGHITTIDREKPWPELYDDIRRFGWEKYIQIVTLDSRAAANHWSGSPIDLLFIDSSHEVGQTIEELELWVPKIRSNGHLVMDDVFIPYYNAGPGRAFTEYCAKGEYRRFADVIIYLDHMTNDHHGGLLIATVK